MEPEISLGDASVTHEIIDELDSWVQRLAAPVLPAQLVDREDKQTWEFRDQTPLALLVSKAVRMGSGIRAAMLLAEAGFVVESAALLRMVIDFATEAYAIAEGEARNERTSAQQEFVKQFFERRLHGPDEQRAKERRRFVAREELVKSHVRLSNEAGLDGERTRDLLRALMEIYDGYVHGAYSKAMELYHGGRHEFMMRGHESAERRTLLQTAVATVLVRVAYVLGLVALLRVTVGFMMTSPEQPPSSRTHWTSRSQRTSLTRRTHATDNRLPANDRIGLTRSACGWPQRRVLALS